MEDEDPEFLPGDFISNTDQMLGQMTEIGKTTASYCRSLIDSGFPAEVAFRMAIDWHQSYWQGAHSIALDFEMEDEEDDDSPEAEAE